MLILDSEDEKRSKKLDEAVGRWMDGWMGLSWGCGKKSAAAPSGLACHAVGGFVGSPATLGISASHFIPLHVMHHDFNSKTEFISCNASLEQ